MTGEHFSSSTGKDLDKQKDAYVRFRWETKKGEKRPKQTILEKEKVLEYKEMADWLERQQPKSSGSCVCCQKPAAWPLLKFEFYNWEAADTETEVFAHEECLKTMWPKISAVFEGLRLLGKNPTVFLELNCLSADKCGFFNKSSDFRNCQHIALRFDQVHEDNHDGTISVHMSPILFCKRTHPGEFYLETEEETWWNVEEAGLVLMAKRITESFNSPQIQAQIKMYKQQNPGMIAELRRLIAENAAIFSLISPQAMFFTELLAEPTPEEKWETIQEGNDYY